MSEVLPAPDGAVMTNNLPAFAFFPLFKVLDLLADLLDQQLELERAIGNGGAGGLGGEGVRLPIQLLGQKIQALALRRSSPGRRRSLPAPAGRFFPLARASRARARRCRRRAWRPRGCARRPARRWPGGPARQRGSAALPHP